MTDDFWITLLKKVFSGDQKAQRMLLEEIWPIVHARTAKVLRTYRGPGVNADIRQEVEDLIPEVLIALISDDWRLARMWNPERRRSFPNFVGKLTEWRVCSLLRKRKGPWIEDGMDESGEVGENVEDETSCPDDVIASRELAKQVYDGARQRLTNFGWRMFEMIVLEQLTADEIFALTGMSPNAAHVWRHRIRALIKELLDGANQ